MDQSVMQRGFLEFTAPAGAGSSFLLERVASWGRTPRLLFSSYHGYLDPSSGAALSTRHLLELLAGRGWQCRVLCGPHVDFEAGPPLEQLLAAHRLPFRVRRHAEGPRPFALYHYRQGGVPVATYGPHRSNCPTPSRQEGYAFLALFERLLDRFRPDLLLTYGGHWLAQEVMATARHRGVPIVFALHNFGYRRAETFRHVDAVLVPSQFAADHYQRTLGLPCTALPGPWNWEQVRCPEVQGRYVTFVNPQPHKGVFVFARIAHELGRRRPDIPLLVVEGRAKADWLGRSGLDLSGPGNVHVMANTPDPRAFYGISRLVLLPSLWRESLGRVAVEALINGIPVLGSRRGCLPETLAEAGFLLDIPERYTPEAHLVPSADEVAPWVETIIRLWDDAALYEREQQRCRAAAEAWRPERLAPRFETFFASVLARPRVAAG